MFGAETSGLPKEVFSCMSKQCVVVFHRALSAGQIHRKTIWHLTQLKLATGCQDTHWTKSMMHGEGVH